MSFSTKEREVLFIILCFWNSLDWSNKILTCFVEHDTNYKYWFWTTRRARRALFKKRNFKIAYI